MLLKSMSALMCQIEFDNDILIQYIGLNLGFYWEVRYEEN